MKLKAIDHIIKEIERKADAVGYLIDEDKNYRAMCQIITDFDHDGKVPTYAQKQFCADVLELLCDGLGLRYYQLLDDALKSCYGE